MLVDAHAADPHVRRARVEAVLRAERHQRAADRAERVAPRVAEHDRRPARVLAAVGLHACRPSAGAVSTHKGARRTGAPCGHGQRRRSRLGRRAGTSAPRSSRGKAADRRRTAAPPQATAAPS